VNSLHFRNKAPTKKSSINLRSLTHTHARDMLKAENRLRSFIVIGRKARGHY